MSESKEVYKAINAVSLALSKEGVAKDSIADTGAGGKYKFRGIDSVLNALSSKLAEHKLCILPRVMSRSVTERTNSRGTIVSYVVLEVEFDFVSAVDGSSHVVRTVGEAMDSSDKGTNKAMSAAYKYAAFQAFAIPTEGDNDTENSHHEVVKQPAPVPTGTSPGAGPDTGADVSFYSKCLGAVRDATDVARLDDILSKTQSSKILKQDQKTVLSTLISKRKEEL